MRQSLTSLVMAMVIAIQLKTINAYQGCATNFSVAVGCLSCDNSSLSYAYNRSEFKYTCTTILNCVEVEATETCVTCASPSVLYPGTNACLSSEGCIEYLDNVTCLRCEPINYVNINGTCYFKAIPYCEVYVFNNGTLGCQKCLYDSMAPGLNCSFNGSLCEVFDYAIMKCTQCPNGSVIHSESKSCYIPIANCLYYDSSSYSKCLLCQTNYIYDQGNNICVLGQTSGIDSQLISYNLNTLTAVYSQKCLNNLKKFNQLTFRCDIDALDHCATRNSSSICIECLPGYYLNGTTCKECSVAISSCAACTNSTYCTACVSGYYLLNVSSTLKCMPCSSFGCLECLTSFDANGLVKCLSCPVNYTLYLGSCIACTGVSQAYSIQQSKCLQCNQTIPDCSFCKFTVSQNPTVLCLECTYNYFYNATSGTCIPIQATTMVTFETAYQVLKKVAPGSEKVIYGDKNALMSSCNSTDGYICRCNVLNTTSLCNAFVLIPDITQLVFTNSSKIASYPDELRMAAELPTFDLAVNLPLTTFQPLTLYQFWNLLSAFSFSIIRLQTLNSGNGNVSSTISRIFSHTAAMVNVFSDQKITVLRGNGFYFKYIPKGLTSGSTGDDDYISTSLSSAEFVAIYAYYSRLLNETVGMLTGMTYIYTSNPQTSFTTAIRKTRYYNDVPNLSVHVEGKKVDTSNVSLSSGYLTVTNFPKSDLTVQKGVSILGTAANATDDIYKAQRIENIFYSESWLYILFFVALYLIFIPLCAIVDCCETEQYMRKHVNTEQPTENQKESNNENEDDATIVKVNYRDFFPLYNVGNTPRPRRLTKVCLFIINTEHIITFLTLIYFNLAGSIPVAAIALVIPGYLCTVIMGYLLGAVFRALPGNFKYLINLLSLGYWILWIFLMKIMSDNPSREYRLFILVFSILSFFLDLTIDALETLLVYFAIKQGDKQISLFNCLAKWLSLRGYYEFDKLAKQLAGDQ